MRERALQLLDPLGQQLSQRPSEHRRTPDPQGPGRVRVDDGGPQVRVHQDHTPAGVLEQRLAQGDGPLQIDLRVHLAEGAVHPGGLPVRSAHGGGLGPYEHASAVLGQQRELVHLAPGGLHRGQQPRLDLLGVRGPHGPPGEPAPPHGLRRGPAENPLGLAVPMGDDPIGVERAQCRVHPVQQRGKQIRTSRLGLVRPQLVGGPTTPGSTHLDPLQAASARTARQFAHSPSFNSNVTQPTSCSPKMGRNRCTQGFRPASPRNRTTRHTPHVRGACLAAPTATRSTIHHNSHKRMPSCGLRHRQIHDH
jgi:hypothetical protein